MNAPLNTGCLQDLRERGQGFGLRSCSICKRGPCINDLPDRPLCDAYSFEVKETSKGYLFRYRHWPEGEWKEKRSAIDALLDYVKKELGIKRSSHLVELMNGSSAAVSRCRHGLIEIPHEWFLNLHELSNIPVAELRAVANRPGIVKAHDNARKTKG